MGSVNQEQLKRMDDVLSEKKVWVAEAQEGRQLESGEGDYDGEEG